ncbi:MAG: hypothetical protein RL456_484 [Pseudomonadota bacterium]|jgi:two-component system OmpR family sensor kinase
MPDRPIRLEAQLHGRVLLLVGLIWLFGSLAATLGLRYETNEVLDAGMRETAQRLLMLPDASIASADKVTIVESMDERHEHIVYQILDDDDHILLRSRSAPDTPMAPRGADGVSRRGEWRVVGVTMPDRGRRALVAEANEHRRASMWAATRSLLVALVLVLPLTALGLHFVMRRGFDKLRPVLDDLAQRPAHDLQPVSLLHAPAELQPLLETVNGLMARVDNLLEAERSFSAKMAHELRTPLAAARAQAQRLAQETEDDRARERALALVRQLARLTHLATRLLQIARIDSGVALRHERLDLRLLARLVVGEFPQSRDAQRLTLDEGPEPAWVDGDLDALGIAVRNLIDNALKHGGEQARVQVVVRPGEVRVVDDGPGAPQADLQALARPFERGITLASGAGLGLAMVQTIARQSGAEMALASPVADGRGWQVSLRFAAPPPDGAAGVSPA